MYWIIAIIFAAYVGSKFIVRLHKHDLHEDARLHRIRRLGQRGDIDYGGDTNYGG